MMMKGRRGLRARMLSVAALSEPEKPALHTCLSFPARYFPDPFPPVYRRAVLACPGGKGNPATRGLVLLFIMSAMQDLLAKNPTRDFREGSIVKGHVLEVRPREVLVD